MKINSAKTIIAAAAIFAFFAFGAFDFVSAAEIKIKYLPQNIGQTPGGLVAWFYKFALGFAGAAAFAVVLYGAILYTVSAGNPSKQGEAKDWISGAIWGVVLLMAAYLILYTINPDIVDLQKMESVISSKMTSISGGISGSGSGVIGGSGGAGGEDGGQIIDKGGAVVDDEERPTIDIEKSPGEGGGSAKGIEEQEARDYLKEANIGVKDKCSGGQSQGCVNLEGMKYATLYEVINLSYVVGSENVYITGGTEGKHNDGVYSHKNGYKADLRVNETLDNYIKQNYQYVGKRKSDGADQYVSPSSGAVYAREGGSQPHWDVLVR